MMPEQQKIYGSGASLFIVLCNLEETKYIILIFKDNYLRSTNFRGYIFSRISPFLAVFVKLNTCEIFLDVRFTKINTRNIFLQLKFAKIIPRKKS